MQLIQGNIENFRYLSRFKNLKDFNNHVEQWMLDIKDKFTKSELIALKRLIRFSSKVAGVCNAKIGTITKATHELDGAGISRSTLKRMVAKAKDLGFLTVYETERKNGSQSSNLFVFNGYGTALKTNLEPPGEAKLNHRKNYQSSKTINKNIKDIRNTGNDVFSDDEKSISDSSIKSNSINKPLDASYVSCSVPSAFINFVKCFFDDAEQIEEYWKLVTISANKHKISGDRVETAIKSFKILIRKMKKTLIKNVYGFFYGILNKKFTTLYWQEVHNVWWGNTEE